MADGIFIEKTLNNFAAEQVGGDDFFNILNLNKAVESIFGENFDKGALRAETEAANLVYFDSVADAEFFNTLGDKREYFIRAALCSSEQM